ncbi:DegT/DnrJ/EryC1/StrS family aminotransferase [Paraburkholderia saeva]|uniref:DegT/DnrJ/EryC1/StrS family aminotransferase n=1 Tax=Paraburkholderia saeva TaxID=2777537 RepID=UPI001E1AA8D9|nr:DegT/DnrJ/EryC1/StrS family aminotransferase [Paraburkholderia saeva]CAG4906772.1 dTDP-3-amino-3,6-dideoxy-alpha-D-galactopyranose transaminase [Paraburkholderia saeva]
MKEVPLYRHPVDAVLHSKICDSVRRVVDSNRYILGEEVYSFEREFADVMGAAHCVSVGNGTDALEIALRAAGVKASDRVGLVANAGFYGSTAVRTIGAEPVYADVCDSSLNLGVDQLAGLFVMRPKVIIVTHLYGRLADIERIVLAASREGVQVIEDCAQSHGAMRDGRFAGTFGVAGCFSFYPTKNLGAIGDGGAIITADSNFAERVRQIRQYGWSSKYRNELEGGRNSRLDEIQAAVLRVKLPYLRAWNDARRHIASRYNSAFADLPLQCPPPFDESSVAHLYTMRVANREAFRRFMKEVGVATDVHYPVPDHQQAAYASSTTVGTLLVTDASCNTVVTLPCFPGLTDEEVGHVIDSVLRYFAKERV